MARRPTQSPPEDRVLSVADIRSGIERITRRLGELQQLDPRSIANYRSPQIVSLETAIEQTLAAVFGNGTPKFKLFQAAFDLEPAPVLRIVPDFIAVRGGGGGHDGVNVHELQQGIAERQQRAVALLEQAIRGLEEEMADKERQNHPRTVADTPEGEIYFEIPSKAAPDVTSRKVFLVHGRDDTAKNEVALFLRAIDLEPIILHLRPNGGRPC